MELEGNDGAQAGIQIIARMHQNLCDQEALTRLIMPRILIS